MLRKPGLDIPESLGFFVSFSVIARHEAIPGFLANKGRIASCLAMTACIDFFGRPGSVSKTIQEVLLPFFFDRPPITQADAPDDRRRWIAVKTVKGARRKGSQKSRARLTSIWTFPKGENE